MSLKYLSETFELLDQQYYQSIKRLIPVISLVVMLLHFADMAESYFFGYTPSLYWEVSRVLVFAVVIIIHRFFGLSDTIFSHMIVLVPFLFLYGTLWLPDENYFLTLPWLIFMSIVPFWLFNKHIALWWGIIQITFLGLVTFLSAIGVVHTLYNTSLLLQLWGVLALAVYVVHSIETKRNIYKEQIQTMAMENKLLYDEMNHRTKNNLQLIIGLMEQERMIGNHESKEETLDKLAYRVRTFDSILASRMRENEGKIHVPEVIHRIFGSYRWDERCDIAFDLTDVEMEEKQANYLALIMNEAINNIKKHACPNGANKIKIRLENVDADDVWKLTVKDNGTQKPQFTDTSKSGGLQFMIRLASAMPKGHLSYAFDGGMLVELLFADHKEENQDKTE